MGNLSLDLGLRSLLTAQANLETIGHNVANASTPGYSRQELLVSTVPGINLRGLLLGRGVQADVVRRTVDDLLGGRLLRQTSALGRLDARLAGLSEIETYVGSTGSTGIPARLSAFFAGLSTLSTAPGDRLLRAGAVQSTVALAQELNALAGNVERLREDTVQALEGTVGEVNALAQRIGDLNQRIPPLESGLSTANDLRDQRDQAIRELSELADVRVIEEQHGAVRVLLGGHMLVSPSKVFSLEVDLDPATGKAALQLGKNGPLITISGGRLGGLSELLDQSLPDMAGDLDDFAKILALEANRVHSTGLPPNGPFQLLTAANAIGDEDGNGVLGNELVADAGLPFEVVSGTLYVNVTDLQSGALEKHAVVIDAQRTSVDDFLSALDAIDGLNAQLDPSGRVQVFADPGRAFDFSPRLDPDPDPDGAFGGGKASLATGPGPFTLAPGDTLDLTGPGGPFTITFAAGSFQQIAQASAGELAAAINADPNVQASGINAVEAAGRLVLQTVGSGSSETFTVAGGSALAALGWSSGTVVSGQDSAVDVRVSGAYTGSKNGMLVFQPLSDGIVGTTAGLQVQVRDQSGGLVATLDVGAGYTPGDEIELPDGVRVRLGYGELSASHGDVFALDVLADADETDVLAALGLNALFTGSDAATIAVRKEIQADPDLLSTALTPEEGDALNALRLLALDSQPLTGFAGRTLSERFGEISGGLGQEIGAAQSSRDAEGLLLASLQARRDELSGVNVDEELVRMIEQEQVYGAAAQFLRVVNDMQTELMNIL